MITAIIVDDEPINISNLRTLINRHCDNIEVIATATSADEAVIEVFKKRPEVIFLDIDMPGKNGFDLLRALDERNFDFDVVFVTAYDEFGIMAIKFSALDYLLKPINTTELKLTVQRITNSANAKKENLQLRNLLNVIDRKVPDDTQKIALPTMKETYLVEVREIIRCASSNNYTIFFLKDGTEHVISKPLYEYEEMLRPYGFFRCHQSHLVNMSHVKSILNEDAGYLLMAHTNQKIQIAKLRKRALKSLLKM